MFLLFVVLVFSGVGLPTPARDTVVSVWAVAGPHALCHPDWLRVGYALPRPPECSACARRCSTGPPLYLRCCWPLLFYLSSVRGSLFPPENAPPRVRLLRVSFIPSCALSQGPSSCAAVAASCLALLLVLVLTALNKRGVPSSQCAPLLDRCHPDSPDLRVAERATSVGRG